MVELSIVTGTYNRFPYLIDMVNSVRSSICSGIGYEIIVVDGGSSDKTLNWCRLQDDIVLIEQGELLGAVKAFNAGAMAARGKYVILANDDIIFVDESILSAYSFMEDNLGVGIGCFWQDRGGYNWHVDTMPAILNGNQVRTHYGQVCIVPKYLGDMVGWWGNYLRTYGGDNELSCNILELGYSVVPIPCACIHDIALTDDLRKLNNLDTVDSDSKRWTRKWSKGKLVGPILKGSSTRMDDRSYRILYAPIYEPGHEIQKSSKKGLYTALSEYGSVVEVDYNKLGFGKVYDVSLAFRPDMILTQIHSIGKDINSKVINDLKEANPDAVLVNWNGDYNPKLMMVPEYLKMLSIYNLCGFVTIEFADIWDSIGINWMYWQIGYENADVSGIGNVHKYDILFLANGYSEQRLELARFLRSLKLDVGIYGSWDKSIRPDGQNLYDFNSGAALYKNCKIAIGDNQWGSGAVGFVSNRLFQSMAAGAFMLHQRFSSMTELLGLKDNVHLSIWDDVDDLERKIYFWLAHDKYRDAIATRGKNYVLRNHSFRARVKELMQAIGHI